MRYEAEIFDKFLYLFEETSFNDHQLHSVITFDHNIDINLMDKSFKLLLEVIPILCCTYNERGGNSYWEKVNPKSFQNIFTVVNNEEAFNTFTTSMTNELTGPQIKACLYQTKQPRLSIVLNHMITDAAGFKQCLYLLSQLYSNLKKDPLYKPDFIINDNRSIKSVTSQFTLLKKVQSLILQKDESNQKSTDLFPMSNDTVISPFIVINKIPQNRYLSILRYSKEKNVTFNDIILSAYYRALARYLKAEERRLTIPIMIDMRKYQKHNEFKALTNLTSSVATSTTIGKGETFDETVKKINSEMLKKKSNYMGMNGFIKLEILTGLLNKRTSYNLLKQGIHNPFIGMTNIGIIDTAKLSFLDSSVNDVYMCGSIKFRPHFQIAVSSFNNTITLSTNLYGSQEDKDNITKFLMEVVNELPRS